MRKSLATTRMYVHIGLLLLAIVCSVLCPKSALASSNITKAEKVVDFISKGDFKSATADFNPLMKSQLTPDKFKEAWIQMTDQAGQFKARTTAREVKEKDFDTVFVSCEFEETTFDIKIIFERYGKICGLWFIPRVDADEVQYTSPVYAHKDRMDEREISIDSGEWKLPGTLSMPKGKGPFPAVVLVHGSGPNDRDETLGPNKPFRDLAEGLASQGIAVLRYDKRTKVYATKIAQSVDKLTVQNEVIDDALAAIKLLRSTEKVNPKKIFVLGHSLGGMLIPRIGKADQNIAGLIVMAGPTRPLEELILEQSIYIASLDGSPSEDEKKQMDVVRGQIANVKSPTLSSSTPASSLPLGVPASYWLDLRDYHPAESAKSLKQPMMILQGGRDYQVTKVDYDGWLKSLSDQPNVTFKLYPKMNHLFMEGEGKSAPQEYEKHIPVSKPVIDDLTAWINSH